MRNTMGDEFTDRILAANDPMLVEMMAAIARKDYEHRRERQAQGIQKAESAGLGIRATARHERCSTTVLRIRGAV